MKLILIDGGPASGKNTLGSLLIKNFKQRKNKAVLLDLDLYIEKYNPSWVWKEEKQRERDLLQARKDFTKDIDEYLRQNFIVIAIGEKFLTKKDIINLVSKLEIACPTYLYHLNPSIKIRRERLHQK